MKSVLCNLCGSDRYESYVEGRDWLYGSPGEFSMVRCTNCGLVYLNPRPDADEMWAHYPESYEPYQRAVRAWQSKIGRVVHRLRLRSRLRLVDRLSEDGGNLLDVGCASGGFLWELQAHGRWQVQGVEIDSRSASFAQERLGLDVFIGDLREAGLPSDSFDIITMWDVIEHLPDPSATLVEIERLLRPGGQLIVSTPNLRSWDARLFGRYWIGLDFPRHLYVFSPETLSSLLRHAGLEVMEFFCFYGRYTTFALSLAIWFNAHSTSTGLQRLFRAITSAAPLRYVTLPYFWLVDQLKRGTIMTLVARKSVEVS